MALWLLLILACSRSDQSPIDKTCGLASISIEKVDCLNILILAHFYPPEMGGAAARLHGLARWLAAFGHRVTVITGLPNYPSGQIFEGYRSRLRVRETMDDVDVLRTWVYASSHRSPLLRLANYLSFVVSSILSGLTAGARYEVILASAPPLFIGLSGWILARFRRIPWVFDIRDLWPDVAVDAGEFAPDAAITRWGYRLARFLYRRAGHITPVTENKRRKLLETGVPSDKMTVIPNGVDLDLSASSDRDWRAELGLIGRFIVLYAGLIGIAQGVEGAIDAAVKLRDQPRYHFLIVGDGVRRAEVIRLVEIHHLTNVTILPAQLRQAIPSLLRAADVAWVPLVSNNLVDAVPSKLLEAWAYRRPVILSASGEAAHLVRQANGGVVIPVGQPDRFAEAVVELASNPELLHAYAEAGHLFVKGRFERKTLARQMEEVLIQVAGLEVR